MSKPNDKPTSKGCVALVGAGSGDPGLITVRGLRLLQLADVVVFDYLANPQLLRHCPTAETIYVGKQAARHAMTQDEINKLLVERGLEGKRVVRLKGGDPFVFGRGGEECQALAAAGVRFEVVPGITAAIGSTAYAGIPITHRDLNSSFTVVTGHEKEADYQEPEARQRTLDKDRDGAAPSTDIDWSVLAKLPALAFYMGVKALPSICKKLIDHGMRPDMPAASIQWGTTPRQRTVTGTISDLPRKVAEAKITPPALTIVGKVVALRDTMNWFETRPLFGQTVVVTRTRQQASDLTTRLEELGARVIEAPTIELAPASDQSTIDATLRKMAGSYDWIIFTSQNGVSFAKERLRKLGLDARAFGPARLAAIGSATADAIRDELCLSVDLCPDSFVAEALAAALIDRGEVKGKRFLLLRADIARPILREKLREAGAATVDDVPIYETRPASALPPVLLEALAERHVDWITFTSSSTARNFTQLLGQSYKEQLNGVRIASIGPITTATLNELGLPPTLQADTYDIDGLVKAILGSPRRHGDTKANS